MIGPGDLLVIHAISEAGTVTEAARQLSTSQPALSRSLKSLERRVGGELFTRGPNGMTPTRLGLALGDYGRAVSAVTERAVRATDDLVSTGRQELALGIVQRIALVPVARAIAAAQQAGGLVVRAHTGDSETLLDRLQAGALDLYIGPIPDNGTLDYAPLFEDHTVLGFRADHPALKSPPDLDALTAAPWILPPANSPTSMHLRALLHDHGLEPPPPAIVTDDVPLIITLITHGDFVAALPRDVAAFAVERGRITTIALDPGRHGRLVGAAQRRDEPENQPATLFVQQLQEQLQSVGLAWNQAPIR